MMSCASHATISSQDQPLMLNKLWGEPKFSGDKKSNVWCRDQLIIIIMRCEEAWYFVLVELSSERTHTYNKKK